MTDKPVLIVGVLDGDDYDPCCNACESGWEAAREYAEMVGGMDDYAGGLEHDLLESMKATMRAGNAALGYLDSIDTLRDIIKTERRLMDEVLEKTGYNYRTAHLVAEYRRFREGNPLT